MRPTVFVLLSALAACSAEKQPERQRLGGALDQTNDESLLGMRVRDAQDAVRARATPEAWTNLAVAWMTLGRTHHDEAALLKAREAVDEALIASPKLKPALIVDATLAQARHRYDKARVIAENLTTIDASDPETWGLLGDAQLALGKSAEAFNAYDRMLAIAPGMETYSRVAHARWLAGDVDGALAMWGKAAGAVKADDAIALAYTACGAADILWNVGKLDEALRAYQAALSAVPEYPDALLGRGRVLFAKGDFTSATTDFQQVVPTDRRESALHWLAAAQQRTGSDASATLSALADDTTVRDPEASVQARAARGIAPNETLTRARNDSDDALCIAAYRANALDEAQAPCARALLIGSRNPSVLAHAGLVELARGDASGHERISQALGLNPMFDPVVALEAAKEAH